MSFRAWLGLVLALALTCLGGCAALQGPAAPGRFPVESIELPAHVPTYATRAQPDTAPGTGAEKLRAEIAAALAKRGEKAELDGALSATASWGLREVHEGRGVDLIGAEAASRHFGFGGVVMVFMAFDARSDETWREQLERAPRNLPINRYGVRTSPSGQSAAVVFGSVELSYQPIPRVFEPGEQVSLKGQVAPRFSFSHVYLTRPDGKVEEQRMTGRTLEATFKLDAVGKYRLEVMGDGRSGPVVVSNVPLYVGIPEPAAAGIAGTVVEPAQAEARMLVLLNEARASAKVSAVQPDAELRVMALAHSVDMVEQHFFGHVSPTTGGPEDRARASGFLVSLVGENVAAAATPEVAHEGLMSSPGHRANMLRAEFTHVGIGATKNDNGLVVTMVFGRRPSPDAMPTSSAQVARAIVALRAGKGLLTPSSADEVYSAGAQAGAEALANGQAPSDIGNAVQQALQRAVNRLRTSRPGGCIASVDLLELSQLNEIPSLSLPGLKRFGVGARVRRDEKGERLSTVFMFEGVACK
jgi:uncharacterized protein YkwD